MTKNKYFFLKIFNSVIAFGIILPFIYLSLGAYYYPLILPIIFYLCLSAIVILIFFLKNIKLKNININGKIIKITPIESDNEQAYNENPRMNKIEYEIIHNLEKYKIVEVINSKFEKINETEIKVYLNPSNPAKSTVKAPMDLIKGSLFILIFLLIVTINLKKLLILYFEQ